MPCRPNTCLFGWQRKLAMVPLAILMMAWLVYATGFIWSVTVDAFQVSEKSGGEGRREEASLIVKVESGQQTAAVSDAVHFPFYFVLVGGLYVGVVGVLHAMVPLSVLPACLSVIAWSAVTVLESLHFACLSWVMYKSSLCLNKPRSSTSYLNIRTWLMFVGTVVDLACWCLLLILARFYRTREQTWNVNHSQEYLADKRQNCPYRGPARVFSLLLVIVSVAGWSVFVYGYHQWVVLGSKSYSKVSDLPCDIFHEFTGNMTLIDNSGEPVVIAVFICGPLLFLTSLLLAGCSGKSSTLAVVAAVLRVLFVMSAGFLIVHMLIHLFSQSNGYLDISSDYIMLWGLIASLISMALVQALIPFYRQFERGDDLERDEAEDDQIAVIPHGLNQPPDAVIQPHMPARNAAPPLVVPRPVTPSPMTLRPATPQCHRISPPPDYDSAQNMRRPGDQSNERQPLLQGNPHDNIG